MQHVILVHPGETKSHFVQSVSTKVLRVSLLASENNFFHGSLVHEFEEDKDFLAEVVDIVALDQLFTVEVVHESRLLHGMIQIGLINILNVLHRKQFLVAHSYCHVNLSESALADRIKLNLILEKWTALLYLDRFTDGSVKL